jgi:dihydrofolate reductase
MPIALVAAMAGKRRTIGKNNDLPWHFPSDLKFFKETTYGHTVLCGRKTYQAILKQIGKPLPGRKTVVLTRDTNFKDERISIIHNFDDMPKSNDWLFIIGGQDVYTQTLAIADRLILTEIEKEFEGDAFFPAFDKQQWRMDDERVVVDSGVTLRFRTYNKARA